MKYVIRILRQKFNSLEKYIEDFNYETNNPDENIIYVLRKLNSMTPLLNSNGKETDLIEFECACIQKKCGACAMIINGEPMLACSFKLRDAKDEVIKLEPLKKFKTICDLVIDRQILQENLKTLKLWLEKDSNIKDKRRELNYEASECIQCGLCLEVCPNFYCGGSFYGFSSIVLTTRLLTELDKMDRDIIAKLYSKHNYSGCGKSLACKKICPKKIDSEKMLVNANLLAIWKIK